MPKKIAVFCTWPVEYVHRLALNTAVFYSKQGDTVDLIDVSYLAVPIYSLLHNKHKYLSGISLLLLRRLFRKNSYYLNFKSIKRSNDLLGIQIGYKVFSPLFLFSFKRKLKNDRRYDLYLDSLFLDASGAQKDEISLKKRIRGSSILAYVKSYLALNRSRLKHYDEWIIYNGRFPVDYMLREIARENQITSKFFEVGFRENSFCIYEESPHSLSEHKKNALTFWHESNNFERNSGAMEYLENRIRHKDSKSLFWSGNQSIGNVRNLPKKKILTFFLSTEGELASVPFETKNIFEGQNESVIWIIQNIDFQFWHVVIRGHPNRNLNRPKDLILKQIPQLNIRGEDITYISEEDSDDSIELIKRSDLICLYDSSIGIDAIYLKKPTMIFGKPLFTALCNNPLKSTADINFSKIDSLFYDIRKLKIWAWYAYQYGIEFFV